MKSYEAARGYFSFLSFLSWALMVFGGMLILASFAATGSQTGMLMILGAAPGLAFAVFGFFGLVYVQTSRATVDSAEYAQQALKLSRDQFEVSKQLLKLAGAREGGMGYKSAAQPSELKNVSYDTAATKPNGYGSTVDTAHEQEPVEAIPAIEETHQHAGTTIEKVAGQYRIGNDLFATLEAAKQAVDRPDARSYLALNQSTS